MIIVAGNVSEQAIVWLIARRATVEFLPKNALLCIEVARSSSMIEEHGTLIGEYLFRSVTASGELDDEVLVVETALDACDIRVYVRSDASGTEVIKKEVCYAVAGSFTDK